MLWGMVFILLFPQWLKIPHAFPAMSQKQTRTQTRDWNGSDLYWQLPSFSFHSGKDIGGTAIFQYRVKFKYRNGEEEIIGKSHSIYSRAEAENFKQTGKFFIMYKGKRAVISQLPENK